MKFLQVALLASISICIVACGGKTAPADSNPTPVGMKDGPGLLSGDSGNILDAFRGKGGDFSWGKNGSANTALGVNGYMWRAALETMSFLPLSSADSNGGVIITDWAVRPDDSSERVKATVYLFGKTLSSTAVQVKLFKQRHQNDMWIDVQTKDATSRQLEDAILTRARQLKIQSVQTR